ncbi:MAG: DUF4349 domain-containing protein [Anaerolineales bacterium]|nr:DUF4349 domain-containing protein [Anaerolineales bacterium]
MAAPSKHMILKMVTVLVSASLILAACAQAAAPGGNRQIAPMESVVLETVAVSKEMEMPAASAPVAGVSDAAQTVERIVIKNGSLTIVVPDPSKSMENISAMAEEMGGFVVSANLYKQTIGNGVEVPRASITIRVPAERMDEAMRRIKSESKQDALNETINSQDVTSEYTDLQSRLKNLEAAETELTEIMKDARRTEDVLAVYNQLVQIREQIEVIKGQIQYYEQSAALSAISTELIADAAVQPLQIGGWQPQGVIKEAVEALVRTMQGVVNAAIWIVIYVLPVLLVLSIVFILPPALLIRAWLRRRASKKSAPPPLTTVEK